MTMETGLREESQIRQFFAQQTVLVTGCTGFVGKLFLEKLLRSCDVKTVYTIIRPKRPMTSNDRFEEVFANPLFDTLRQRNPECRKKIVVVSGDITKPGLDLSPDDRRLMRDTVTLIIHIAAAVTLTTDLSDMLRTNVGGTKEMLDFACDCTQLKAFMYMSSSYSQPQTTNIEERCYSPPGNVKSICNILDADTVKKHGIDIASIKQPQGPCRNGYTYSKAMAEGLVEEYSKKVSFVCGIFRPAAVVSTWKEPIQAWCESFRGPTTLTTSYGLGVLKIAWLHKQIIQDIVPADMMVNGLLGALWDLTEFKKPVEKCYVYHYATSILNPVTTRDLHELATKGIFENPTIKATWYPGMICISNRLLYFLLSYLLNIGPGPVVDTVRMLFSNPPYYMNTYRRLKQYLDLTCEFYNRHWQLEMWEMLLIWKRMNQADHEEFFQDVRQINWEKYTRRYWDGIRKYILRDPEYTIPAARRKLVVLKMIHYTLIAAIVIFFLYCVYKLSFNFIGL